MKKIILIFGLLLISRSLLFSQIDTLLNNTWRLEYLIQKEISNLKLSDNSEIRYILYFDTTSNQANYNLSVNTCLGNYSLSDTNKIIFEQIYQTIICCDNEFSELLRYMNNDTFQFIIEKDTLSLFNDKIEYVFINNNVPVSINAAQSNNNEILIYPTISASLLQIELPTSIKIKQMKIFDINGQIKKEINCEDRIIDIESFSSGIYFLKIELWNQVPIVKTIVKNKQGTTVE